MRLGHVEGKFQRARELKPQTGPGTSPSGGMALPRVELGQWRRGLLSAK